MFGTELPTAEEYRHGCRVAKVADEITSGRFAHMTDGAEEKRVRKSAEEIVKREEARKSLPPRRFLTRSDFCGFPGREFLNTHRDYHQRSQSATIADLDLEACSKTLLAQNPCFLVSLNH